MNRRRFLSRAALALGGALLAPLVGAVKRTEAADGPITLWEAISATNEPTNTIPGMWLGPVEGDDDEGEWVKAFDPADIERAFAEPVETWDFPSGDEEDGFDTGFTSLTWNHTTATEGVTVETWTYTGWREVGD